MIDAILPLEQAQQLDAVDALVTAATVHRPTQHWSMEISKEERMIYLTVRLDDDPDARPRWRWSLRGDNGLINGTETLVEDVKEILYTYDAYVPASPEEAQLLDAKIAAAYE